MQEIITGVAGILAITALRYFVVAGAAFIIFYKFFSNHFASSKIQKRHAGNHDFIQEMMHSLVSVLVFSLIGFIVLYTPLSNYTLVYKHLNKYPAWWLFLSVPVSLIVHDTYFYWMHRLLHHKKVFRYAHLVHHKSTNPSPWAAYSFHVFESVVEGGVLVVLAFIMPMHPIAVALFILAGFVINVYGHLGYEIMPKWLRQSFLFQVINTSVHHNLHHSKFKGNYGLYFRLWDRLLKTEHPDYVKEYDRIQQQRFGKPQQSHANASENIAA